MWNKAIAINMWRTKANTEVDHGCKLWANAEELIQHRVLAFRYSFELRFQGERNGDGHIGYAWMLFDPANAVVSQDDKYVGQGMSWHVAEYTALLEGLTVARSLNLKHIVAYGTSRIVCNQVNRVWRAKQATLLDLWSQVMESIRDLYSFKLKYMPRDRRSPVNALANDAIIAHLAGHPITAVTSTSSKEQAPTLEHCPICLEEKPSSDMSLVEHCLHKFCEPCMKRHAEVQVQAGQVPVRCPQADCLQPLTLAKCQKLLTVDVFNSLTKRLAEASIPEGDRVYCPYRNCSALMNKTGLRSSQNANSSSNPHAMNIGRTECVECARSFCVECRVPWHLNRSCQEYQQLPLHLRDSEDSNLYKLAENQNWQRCRKCCRMIELAEGCYHMTCRCGYEFCYTCGAEWKDKKQSCSCKLWDERNLVHPLLIFDSDDDEDVDLFVEYDESDVEDGFLGELYDLPWLNPTDHADHIPFELMQLFDDEDDMVEDFFQGSPPLQYYKTKLCRYFARGYCALGPHCTFAHGEGELR
ncbi:unnamed protein product [Sphagnum balticum]